MSDPTDQRHRSFQALQQQQQVQQGGQAPQQPQPPPPWLAMQRPPARPPGGFGGVAALMPPLQGAVTPARDPAAAAEDAARARLAEQMAYEDASKACNPDFTTPFATVEDAVSRLLPYHVFADYEDEDDGSINLAADEEMEATQGKQVEEFEKFVTSFNIINRRRAEGTDRAEERYMLANALRQQEQAQLDRVRSAILQEKQAEHARRMVAQSQDVNAWPLVPTNPAAWHDAPAVEATGSRGAGVAISGAGNVSAAPGTAMLPQQKAAATSAWQLQQLGVWPTSGTSRGGASTSGHAAAVAAASLQQQQLLPTFAAPRGGASTSGQATAEAVLQQLHQHHLALLQRFAASCSEASSSGQASAEAVRQQQQLAMLQRFAASRGEASSSGQAAEAEPQVQAPSGGAAAGGMVQPWWGSGVPRRQ